MADIDATAAASQANGLDKSELRQRLPTQPEIPQQASSIENARETVSELNANEARNEDKVKERKTYGRTPDGTVFTVPQTHDMVSSLLSPTQPKNLSDIIVILCIGLHVAALAILPTRIAIPFFGAVYICWRLAYNGGIGYLLDEQSKYNTMVNWAVKSGVFTDPADGNNRYPWLYSWLKREMETKIPNDYVYAKAPVEYNTWLAFRSFVDLILMCDFTAYMCFAISCGRSPDDETFLMTIGRWVVGIVLVLFNLWVKLDAHRVVKDYAWYWGDFFFLIDQELTFDGVFQMAPHPMYSVGYAGYYGFAMMAASYKVLFISIFAHACQFAFLALVESPHIEKTYNPPPPRRKSLNMDNSPIDEIGPTSPVQWSSEDVKQPYMRGLVGLSNVDFFRVPDLTAALIQGYLFVFAIFTPSTPLYQAIFVLNAAAWRLWYSVGIGYILSRQSAHKEWTRHFIKYGESHEEAWRQWKGIYHVTMSVCYASFAAAAYKMYSLPPNWEYGMSTLRHVLGVALVSLQIWTVTSIYDSLGEFGWFFGDFFFDDVNPRLTYAGIYRFLNNPERVIGLAGVWGAVLITWSKSIFVLALISHLLTILFIQMVEKPHMQRRYGRSLREHSGLSTSIKNSLPSSLRKWQGNVDRVLSDTANVFDEFIDAARPKFAAGYNTVVKDTQALFHDYPARMQITRLAPDLAGFDSREYSLEIEGTSALQGSAARDVDKVSGREGDLARVPLFRGSQYQPILLEYGAPIRVRWTAPLHHSKYDWIGLYMIADNVSRDVTRVSSQGRWIATSAGAYDSARVEQGQITCDERKIIWADAPGGDGKNAEKGEPRMTGEVEFRSDKLWWTTGVFEFRYHHDGKHNVMAISKPFEVRIGRLDDDEERSAETEESFTPISKSPSGTSISRHQMSASVGSISNVNEDAEVSAVEKALLPIVRNCFDRDPAIAPNTPEEGFGGLVEREGKFAKRVVFAVAQMFGIDLAPSVVKSDGCVRNLAWRIVRAKRVLAQYSMSQTPKGVHTPE